MYSTLEKTRFVFSPRDRTTNDQSWDSMMFAMIRIEMRHDVEDGVVRRGS